MNSLRSSVIRVSAGLITFTLLAALVEFPFHHGAVPFLAYVPMGVLFSLAFLLFGRPIIFGLSLQRRVFPSYFVSASIVAIIVSILFLIRTFPPA